MTVQTTKQGASYVATIAGGWWVAYGKTAKEAQKRVLKRWEQEIARHDGRKTGR